MPLEQMREAGEPESAFDQSIIGKRAGRKRKAPADEDVRQSADFGQPSIGGEVAEAPSLIPQTPMPQTPMPPEISLTQEPSVPDISGMMSSVIEPSGIMEPVPEVPTLGMDIPQIPPSDVSSLLGTTEEPPPPMPQPEDHSLQLSQSQILSEQNLDHLQQLQIPEMIPQVPEQIEDIQQMEDMSHLPQMENMGYDQVCVIRFLIDILSLFCLIKFFSEV